MLADYRRQARCASDGRLSRDQRKPSKGAGTIPAMGCRGVGSNTEQALRRHTVTALAVTELDERNLAGQVHLLWIGEFGTVACAFLRIPPGRS